MKNTCVTENSVSIAFAKIMRMELTRMDFALSVREFAFALDVQGIK